MGGGFFASWGFVRKKYCTFETNFLGTHVQIFLNKFGKSFTYSYLCNQMAASTWVVVTMYNFE